MPGRGVGRSAGAEGEPSIADRSIDIGPVEGAVPGLEDTGRPGSPDGAGGIGLA